MAKDKLIQYDSTAANNTDCGSVNLAENSMLPSDVNNYAREIMSHLKEFADGTSGINVLSLTDDTDTNQIKVQAPSSVTTTTTFTMPDGDGSADQVLKTDGSGQLDWVAQTAVAPNPNLIINGAMQVAQRGTTSTNVSGFTTVDRWHTQFVGGGITTTQESLSSSDTPYSLGFRNYLRMDNDTSTSGAGDVRQIFQTIEAQNIANSGWNYTSTSSYVTLSLWVRTSLAGKYRFALTSSDGTAQAFNFTETLAANTWTKITKTIPGNSNLTVNNDNGAGLTVTASLWFGTNYTDDTTVLDAWSTSDATKSAPTDIADWGGTSNATFDITGVKLEVGSSSTSFIHEDYGTTLEKCQRYFFKSGQMWMSGYSYGVNNSNDGFVVPVFWPTTMRKVNPSVTFSGGSDGGSGAALFTAYVQEEGMSINLRSTNSGTNVWWSGFIISADAEL